MFAAGDRVYWVSNGLRRLGTVEHSAPQSLKARVKPAAGDPEEILVRRLFAAPAAATNAGRVLERDHATAATDTAVDHATREASFVASDGTVDRFGDVLDPGGWDLTAFRRNPVFLWQHDNTAPIGTVPSIHVRDDRLIARARFIDAGIMPLADQLFRLVEAGHLCAVSIGARSLAEPEPILDDKEQVTGFRYSAMELLELSLVSVPANPNALLLGRQYNIDRNLLLRAFEIDASVVNLEAYFDAKRAQIPGVKLTPRPAKQSQHFTGERSDETHIRSDRRNHEATRVESDRAGRTAHQGGDGKPRPNR